MEEKKNNGKSLKTIYQMVFTHVDDQQSNDNDDFDEIDSYVKTKLIVLLRWISIRIVGQVVIKLFNVQYISDMITGCPGDSIWGLKRFESNRNPIQFYVKFHQTDEFL